MVKNTKLTKAELDKMEKDYDKWEVTPRAKPEKTI
jgi:hypothetical protein